MRGIVVAVAVLIVAGCGGETPTTASVAPSTVTPTASATPDLKACRSAITQNYIDGWTVAGNDPWPPATRAPVCSGIDRPTLQRLMDEALEDSMNGTPGPG